MDKESSKSDTKEIKITMPKGYLLFVGVMS